MRLFSLSLLFILSAIILGCDEELPPKDDPSKIFSGFIEVSYIYSPQQNGILFIATVVNNFDETLSGNALIEGTMEIEWMAPLDRIPSIATKRTVKLTKENIFKARGYNSSTGKLFIDPLDTVKIAYVWNFKFNDSTDIRNIYFFTIGAKAIGCENRVVYQSQPFRVNCTIKFFDRTAFIQIPEKIVSSCSINFYPKVVCPGMITTDSYQTPCDLLP